jgi:hypothetical protein
MVDMQKTSSTSTMYLRPLKIDVLLGKDGVKKESDEKAGESHALRPSISSCTQQAYRHPRTGCVEREQLIRGRMAVSATMLSK